MRCCGWPSLDTPGDPAFPLAPPISPPFCALLASAVGSTPQNQPGFNFPAIGGLHLGKPWLSWANLCLNPHTWQFSLFSKQILTESLDMLGVCFHPESRSQDSTQSQKGHTPLWRRDLWPRILEPLYLVKYGIGITGLLQLWCGLFFRFQTLLDVTTWRCWYLKEIVTPNPHPALWVKIENLVFCSSEVLCMAGSVFGMF